MQEKHLFEYAVIRIVPRVEREEFLNIGVILYCKKQQFLQTRFIIDQERLHVFANYLDMAELNSNLCAFERICMGHKEAGPIAQLEPVLRFRWLTASRSTIVQTSKTHPGLCTDAQETLNRLFEKLVLPPTAAQQ